MKPHVEVRAEARDARTIHGLFLRSAELYPDHKAVWNTREQPEEPESITYRDLDIVSTQLAAGLSRAGVSHGDRVVLISAPRIRFAAVVLATLKLGAWVVPLDPTHTGEEIAVLTEHAEAAAIFGSSDSLCKVPHTGALRVDLDDASETRFVDLLVATEFTLPVVGSDDIAVLAYTSGTTGHPKGVQLSHGNIAADLIQGTRVIPMLADDVLLSIAPWHHILGLVACLILPLYGGATAMYSDEFRRLPEFMSRYGVSIFVAVPKLYHGLYAKLLERVTGSVAGRFLWKFAPRLVGRRIKHGLTGGRLRFFVSGSAPLDPRVAAGFRRMGIGMMEGYGLTETSPVVSVCDPFGKKRGSVGRPLPGVDARILAPGPDGVGELLVRGPIVMQGYYKDESATRQAIDEDGWFHTGDLAVLDTDGEIYIKGRAKNVIVLDTGKKVYPEELEWEIGRIPFVEEVLVRYREEDGAIEAVVYPSELCAQEVGTGASVREVIWREIRTRLERVAPHKRLQSIAQLTIVETPFPKTSTLDIKRHLLHWDDTATGGYQGPVME